MASPAQPAPKTLTGAPKAAAPKLSDLPIGQWLPEHKKLISGLAKWQLTSLTDEDRKQATKPFWFAYFWEEARARPSEIEAHANLLVRFFTHMYNLPDTWDPGNPKCELMLQAGVLRYKPSASPVMAALTLTSANAWSTVSDSLLLELLEKLMEAGFEVMDPIGSANGVIKKADLHAEIDVRRHSLIGELDKAYMLGWRGDGRNQKQIGAAGGLKNKAESDFQGYAASQNMRQPWHPFAQEKYRQKWYFRRAKEDNCLYSVVSVSTDFKTASTFPLLNSDYVVLPDKAPTADDLKNMDVDKQKKWSRVSGASQGQKKTVIRFVDRQQLYLVIIANQYFDTQKKQTDKFPEVAVKEIPDTGIFACVSFIRVHHVTTDSGPMTALLDAARCSPPTIDSCRRYCQNQAHAKKLFAHVDKLYQDTIAALRAKYSVQWTPYGAAEVKTGFVDDDGKPMSIDSVKGWFGESIWP